MLTMILCETCLKEMECTQNGVQVFYGADHAYAGDRYECHSCGAHIIKTNAAPSHIEMETRELLSPEKVVQMP